jgi:hypothetical protein
MSDAPNPRDEQDEAEATDADEIDVADFPPDRPTGVRELLANDVAAADEYAPDDLRRREGRLEPDVAVADDEVPPALTDPERAPLEGAPGEADWDVIDPGAAPSDSASAGRRPDDTWPAEEAALHEEVEPDRLG